MSSNSLATSELHKFGNEEVEILFRKTAPIDVPEARYPGFKPGTTILTKGTVIKPGALPLPCDIIWERDVAVTLRDGAVIYTDIFRPVGGADIPAIVAWGPYGKEEGVLMADDYPGRAGIPREATSGLEKFEGPDPAYWCNHGYAIVNPDARGCFNSEGDIRFWGTWEAQDGYDLIEWTADQSWASGKVGMSGNSWLALMQWFIGALKPPHLTAIAPWEGAADLYRDDVARGGIPSTGFNNLITSQLRGKNRVEDVPAMIGKYPLMNAYWEDKTPKMENIDVPAYVVASWTIIHTRGTLDGFRRIASKDKWLRVHNTMEWPDYYTQENVEDLRRFFDHYLKGIDNGWEKNPRVRLSVLDPGGTDIVDRPEVEFPLSRAQNTLLHIDAAKASLSPAPVSNESSTRYKADDGQGFASFTMHLDEQTELTGYMKLRLWVESDGSDDMDLFVIVQKLDEKGVVLPALVFNMPFPTATGRLRVSHRELDEVRSTPSEPFLMHRRELRLKPGEIVPVEIPIWPTSMLWHKGQQLRVLVAGHDPSPQIMVPVPPPITRNKGYHIIHAGGRYDSHLLVPRIP